MAESMIQGLTQAEVEQRIAQGLRNSDTTSITKTKSEILKENILTLFNFLNVLLAVILALVGAWSNILFFAIILANITIGIVQELHAKKLVDDLSLLITPSTMVLRDQSCISIPAKDLVLDDVMLLDSGKQIICDSVVISGDVEVNESLLTGEADPIHKTVGDHLLSGSSIISGKCYAKVEHIQDENYAAHIAKEAKQLKGIQSEFVGSMKKVTKLTSYCILPLGILLFMEAIFLRQDPLFDAVVFSSAGLLGMLPKGLVLLISTSLAIGVIRLSKSHILIQELHALETLAHVDVVCLDKTGTITSGEMQVEEIYTLDTQPIAQEDLHNMIVSFFYYSDDNNATFQALQKHFGAKPVYEPIQKIAFSSTRKWSAISFKEKGTLMLGAPDKLLKQIPSNLNNAMAQGKRVLVLGYQKEQPQEEQLTHIQPIQAIILQDTIRKQAIETFSIFKEAGMELKVISGDHPISVSAIAKQAGIAGYEKQIDMSNLPNDVTYQELVKQYTVFGRVSPLQKKLLVQALKENGHTVAMSGDGVNDVLAMKEADCSIAIASGADAACQVAQVVLLDSDFSAMPQALMEGRRVVNHVYRVAGVFFIKTIYSTLLSLLCVLLNVPFPFIPIQITLLDLFVEAFPAFITMLEPNHKKLETSFLTVVKKQAMPLALAILGAILLLYGICPRIGVANDDMYTMMYLCVATISMLGVLRSCMPFTLLRSFVCIGMVAGFLLSLSLFPEMFHMEVLNRNAFVFTGIVSVCTFGIATFLMNVWMPKKRYV